MDTDACAHTHEKEREAEGRRGQGGRDKCPPRGPLSWDTEGIQVLKQLMNDLISPFISHKVRSSPLCASLSGLTWVFRAYHISI